MEKRTKYINEYHVIDRKIPKGCYRLYNFSDGKETAKDTPQKTKKKKQRKIKNVKWWYMKCEMRCIKK